MTKAVISVGSNLGNRKQNLDFAFSEIEKLVHSKVLAKSGIYETQAIGGPDQDSFLNAIVLLETEIRPLDLLKELQEIENACGRTREIKWGPRTLDLDIIDYENFTSNTNELQIPHPRAFERRFVIEPLMDIAPDWQLSNRALTELISDLSDQKVVRWQG